MLGPVPVPAMPVLLRCLPVDHVHIKGWNGRTIGHVLLRLLRLGVVGMRVIVYACSPLFFLVVSMRFFRDVAVMRRPAGRSVLVGEGPVGERAVEFELERDAAIFVHRRLVQI